MTEQTPEQRRDAAIADVIAAGGTVASVDPLAHADDPSTVVAYRLNVIAPDPATLTALEAVREQTELDLDGLVPYAEVVPDAGG